MARASFWSFQSFLSLLSFPSFTPPSQGSSIGREE